MVPCPIKLKRQLLGALSRASLISECCITASSSRNMRMLIVFWLTLQHIQFQNKVLVLKLSIDVSVKVGVRIMLLVFNWSLSIKEKNFPPVLNAKRKRIFYTYTMVISTSKIDFEFRASNIDQEQPPVCTNLLLVTFKIFFLICLKHWRCDHDKTAFRPLYF